MIYETIPAKYFDHTALAKAIGEAFAIRNCAGYWAKEAADVLMDDRMLSGDAVEIGVFINWLKNIEFLVNRWIEVFNDITDKMDIDRPLFIDKVDMSVNYMIQKTNDEIEKTDSVFDCINGVYKEWNQQLGILARNYKIQMGTYRSDLFSNGEVERVFAQTQMII